MTKDNMIGKKFGKLTVISRSDKVVKAGHIYYDCQCDCGNTVEARGSRLRSGITKHCGCGRKRNLIGQKFGRLTVIKDSGERKDANGYKGTVLWHCKCECGGEINVRSDSLTSGMTRSCGCLQYENGLASRTHGQSNSRIYSIYQNMKDRCYNPNNERYRRYGGRGISICDEWLNDFEEFYSWAMKNGYKDDLSIDRIDNDGNYEPANCRWATHIIQANNKSTNVHLFYKGEEYTRAELSRELGIDYETFRRKLKQGFSINDIKNGFGSTGR